MLLVKVASRWPGRSAAARATRCASTRRSSASSSLRCPRPAREIVAAAKAEGVLAGLDVTARFPQVLPGLDERDLLVAVSEKRSDAEIDAFAALLGRLGGR